MEKTNKETRFYELVWPHMDAVLRTAQCLTHSSVDAEDLAQETMIKAFNAINTVRDDTHVKAWLMCILRRGRIDQARTSRDESSLDQMEFDPVRDDVSLTYVSGRFPHDPEDVLSTFSDEEIIANLRELPKDIRWTLLLVDVEGMDQCDAASVLGIPVGTVKSRLHRGRAALRASLEPSRNAATPVLLHHIHYRS